MAYDFVEGRTHDGRMFRILTIIDETSRECLALIVARQLRRAIVIARWSWKLMPETGKVLLDTTGTHVETEIQELIERR